MSLARRIAAEIRANGPMRLDRYMALCLGDPEHGYYMTRDPFGAAGDFVTAPEISQMFGEIVGLWAVHAWALMGAPKGVALVELGPGRGTLMADALRAARLAPDFVAAAGVHLIETSPVLRQRQQEALRELAPDAHWYDRLEEVAPGPVILIANEFFDALPIRQFERVAGRWRERVVSVSADGILTLALCDAVPCDLRAAADGAIGEVCEQRDALATAIGTRLAHTPGAALIIDYGHDKSGFGDTLQAVRGHRRADILDDPGACDLTSHVDFEALARALSDGGANTHGPLGMGPFLLRLGIAQRALRLKAGAPPSEREAIDAALHRLTGPEAMGSVFRVLAATSPGMAAPEPFSTDAAER